MPKKPLLIVRVDKIGDLVLSLPADQIGHLQNEAIVWLISQNMGFIPQHALPPRRFHEIHKKWSWSHFFQTVQWIKKLNPHTVIVLYAPPWVNMALWWARVPCRIGRLSQWHSYLFLNKGLRQSRKKGDRHESDLNYELIEKGFGFSWPPSQPPPSLPPLQLQAPAVDLNFWGLTPGQFFVVHPGMAGSALNWPSSSYHQLIEKLIPHGKVVITGTHLDKNYLKNLMSWTHHPQICWLVEKLSSTELLSVLKNARGLVAPSTGVLHLGASLGQKCVGLYSPVPVQSPSRWGPRGPHVVTLTPSPFFKESLQEDSSLMEKITVEQVLEALKKLGAL